MKKSDIFIGRFQPFHLGHAKILDMMNNPVILLVKGGKSSQDKNRNPLSQKDQIRLIKKYSPKAKIVETKNGYIPDIVEQLKEMNIEVDTLMAGDDRIESYKKQNERAGIKINYKLTPRVTSATKVRNAIREDDHETFKKIMPKKLHKEWDNLRKLIK
jgi:nicotinamide mononucleotide adenylyltransferase